MMSDRYRFGDFELADRNLTRAGATIRLRPQEALVLAALLARPFTLVTNEALLRAMEAPRSSKNGLDQVVHRVRSHLGEHAGCIEAVRGRGFKIRVMVTIHPSEETMSDYRVGLRCWNAREPGALAYAMACFERAEKRSPKFAAARAAKADCYAILGSYNWTSASHAAQKARACAHEARAMQSDLAAPHATFGFVESLFEHNWSEAERHFDDALACQPDYGTAHHWLALQHAALGQGRKAHERIEQARKHDPLSPVLDVHAALLNYWNGELDAAEAAARDATLFNGGCWYAWSIYGSTLEAQGRLTEAIALQKDAAERFGGPSTMINSALARAYALSGDLERARRELEPVRTSAERGEGAFHVATAYAALGESNAAFNLLSRAIDHKDVWVSFLAVDPRIDALRSDRRFPKLLSRLRLP